MNIIVPITVTDSMIGAGTTIAEPASGEVVWTVGAYSLGDIRIRITTHRTYQAVQAHSGRPTPPEDDPAFWKDIGPTLRWSPFDVYSSTAAKGVTSFTYFLSPGFFNSLSLYGLVGLTLEVTVKNAPGGSIIYPVGGAGPQVIDLFEQAAGLYELLFTPLRQINRVVIKDIPIHPTAELTVKVVSGTGDPVALGMLNIGDYRSLISSRLFGGTQYGATAEPKSYSYIKYFDDGTQQIIRRGSATDMRGTVVMPSEDATAAVDLVRGVLDVPVSCIATDARGYDYLNVFGLLSGSAEASGPAHSNFSFTVKGSI
jgi:hypothetical protein